MRPCVLTLRFRDVSLFEASVVGQCFYCKLHLLLLLLLLKCCFITEYRIQQITEYNIQCTLLYANTAFPYNQSLSGDVGILRFYNPEVIEQDMPRLCTPFCTDTVIRDVSLLQMFFYRSSEDPQQKKFK